MNSRIYIAPVQGHTDAAWRHFHQLAYGGDNLYFTPFIRAEHGGVRDRDIRDFSGPLSANHQLEPQVIFRDMEELDLLLTALEDEGATRINLNMGCPFPLQTGKGRGAGFIANSAEATRLPEIAARYPGISLSAKMRLGFSGHDEWRGIMPVLNSMPLRFIALHPRVARQQYGGDLDLDMFAEFMKESANPVVFNGELKTPSDISDMTERFADIAGVMLGRGLLGRPSLAAEAAAGEEWPRERRIDEMLRFHNALIAHYEETLCGESQLLSKIKPFCEYAEEEIGRKAWKAIKKAGTVPKYRTALALIE